MMRVCTSATVKCHLKARLRDRFSSIAIVPYVAMRVPLAANSSYVVFFTSLDSLLRGWTPISAPVSTKNEVFVLWSKIKMRRDPKPSPSSAFTDGWDRFPTSTYKRDAIAEPRMIEANSVLARMVSRTRTVAGSSERIRTSSWSMIPAASHSLNLFSQSADLGGQCVVFAFVWCRWLDCDYLVSALPVTIIRLIDFIVRMVVRKVPVIFHFWLIFMLYLSGTSADIAQTGW